MMVWDQALPSAKGLWQSSCASHWHLLLKQLKQLSDASATVQFSKVDSKGSEYVSVILAGEKPHVEVACHVNEVTSPSRIQKAANTSKCRRSQG